MITLEAYRISIGCFIPKLKSLKATSFIKQVYRKFYDDVMRISRFSSKQKGMIDMGRFSKGALNRCIAVHILSSIAFTHICNVRSCYLMAEILTPLRRSCFMFISGPALITEFCIYSDVVNLTKYEI